MKMKLFISAALFSIFSGFSQTQEQLTNMGLQNGCTDAKSTNANERYNQIMTSSAQQRAYKEAYDLGWNKCKATPSGNYTWYKGKMVFYTPGNKPGSTKRRSCLQDFPDEIRLGDCLPDFSKPSY